MSNYFVSLRQTQAVKFIVIFYKITTALFAIASLSMLLFVLRSYIYLGKIIQYRTEYDDMHTPAFYDLLDYLTEFIVLFTFLWPILLIIILASRRITASIYTWLGAIAVISDIILLATDPFKLWFYWWD
ncbi:MAG: hypothetical protein WCF67_24270 [Chitinophagaceae bacterium]